MPARVACRIDQHQHQHRHHYHHPHPSSIIHHPSFLIPHPHPEIATGRPEIQFWMWAFPEWPNKDSEKRSIIHHGSLEDKKAGPLRGRTETGSFLPGDQE